MNLAGESIAARRWTGSVKERIRRSRVDGTRLLAETLGRLDAAAPGARLGVRRRVLRPPGRRAAHRGEPSGLGLPRRGLPRVGSRGGPRAGGGHPRRPPAARRRPRGAGRRPAADGPAVPARRRRRDRERAAVLELDRGRRPRAGHRALPRARHPRGAGERRRARSRSPTASSHGRWAWSSAARLSCRCRLPRSGSCSARWAGRCSSTARACCRAASSAPAFGSATPIWKPRSEPRSRTGRAPVALASRRDPEELMGRGREAGSG